MNADDLGSEMQPFEGIPSFMRAPVSRRVSSGDAVIIGIPFDSGTSFRSGARFGPRAVRAASLLLWGYNNALGVKPREALHVIDYGDVQVVPPSIEDTMANIEAAVAAVLAAGGRIVALGGDHSVTLPLLRAHHAHHGPLSVIHLDSHPDTWDREFGDRRYSHGTGFRRAIEEGLIRRGGYIQIGIRGPTTDAGDLEEARQMGARVLTIDEAFEMGIPAVAEAARTVAEGPTYLTLDIDCADPAFAPGTGTPEVGGFTSHQLLSLLRALRGVNLIGFDLVEVAPAYDHGEITAILAANLVFEMLSLWAVEGDAGAVGVDR
jgi:agmatinase